MNVIVAHINKLDIAPASRIENVAVALDVCPGPHRDESGIFRYEFAEVSHGCVWACEEHFGAGLVCYDAPDERFFGDHICGLLNELNEARGEFATLKDEEDYTEIFSETGYTLIEGLMMMMGAHRFVVSHWADNGKSVTATEKAYYLGETEMLAFLDILRMMFAPANSTVAEIGKVRSDAVSGWKLIATMDAQVEL